MWIVVSIPISEVLSEEVIQMLDILSKHYIKLSYNSELRTEIVPGKQVDHLVATTCIIKQVYQIVALVSLGECLRQQLAPFC